MRGAPASCCSRLAIMTEDLDHIIERDQGIMFGNGLVWASDSCIRKDLRRRGQCGRTLLLEPRRWSSLALASSHASSSQPASVRCVWMRT